MLLETGLIDQFQLDSALSMQRNLGGRIGCALIKLGYLPEQTIADFLETQVKFSSVALAEVDIADELMQLLPSEQMLEGLVVPLDLCHAKGEKILRVAMTDPTDMEQIDALQFKTGCRILAVQATQGEIEDAIRRYLPEAVAEIDADLLPQDAVVPDYNLVDFDNLGSVDPRFECLLELLQGKGVLSAIEVERIKFG
jgi:type IV pilus assembly protein PilB